MLRRILIAAGLLVVGFAPGLSAGSVAAQDASPAAGSCAAPTREDLERIPQEWEDALDGGDLSGLAAAIDPDVIHHGATMADGASADDLTQGLQELLTGFPDLSWQVDLVVADAPYVAASWTASGTQDGSFQGIEPTGRPATWHGINVWRVDCGKAVESWSELDQVGRLQQLGVIPAVDDAAADASSPTAAETQPAAGPASCAADAPQPRELVARLWDEGWTQGDAAAFDAVLTPGVIHHWATGADSIGPAATAERVEGWRQAMPDMAIRYGDIIVDGDYAAAVWTVTGTPAGAPSDAEPARAGGVNIFRIECGQIAEMWSEMDAIGLVEQLNAATTEATPAA